MKHSTLCPISDLEVNKHFNPTKNCEGAWTLIKMRRCKKKTVIEVDIHVGDDDARVEKSLKNEKPQKK